MYQIRRFLSIFSIVAGGYGVYMYSRLGAGANPALQLAQEQDSTTAHSSVHYRHCQPEPFVTRMHTAGGHSTASFAICITALESALHFSGLGRLRCDLHVHTFLAPLCCA